jgi:carbon monoxide dehydrogenase subunit G
MEIELSRTFDATPEDLWAVLLDPEAMSALVPGMQSVEVISDTEYHARIQVKIAFINARFNVRTVITEMTRPSYLRSETTGEDNSVGSSVKSVNEMFLTPVEGEGTELRVKAGATVLGRLGTLGLNPMRTKAARMWDQFGDALDKRLTAPEGADTQEEAGEPDEKPDAAPEQRAKAQPSADTGNAGGDTAQASGAFTRLRRWIGGGEHIRAEIQRNGTTVIVHWPTGQADQCLAWLDRQLGPRDET